MLSEFTYVRDCPYLITFLSLNTETPPREDYVQVHAIPTSDKMYLYHKCLQNIPLYTHVGNARYLYRRLCSYSFSDISCHSRTIPGALSDQTVVSYTCTVARVTVVVRTVTVARAVTIITVMSFFAFIDTLSGSLVAYDIFTLSWACLGTREAIFPS